MVQKWDLSKEGKPVLYWDYTDGNGKLIRFEQADIWHVASNNLTGWGVEGSSTITLAKEALATLMACEEVAGRNFANGLGMGGFLVAPTESSMTETEAQNTVDRLKKDFSGSQNSGKFTILPGGLVWQKMTFNAQESQLLESRKWNAEEVIRLLGGAPLLVKMGLGSSTATYAASSAFLEEYFSTSLLPHCTAIEQSIMRDLIPQKDRATLYVKHDPNVVLRGSLRDRAETYEIQIRSGQLTPNDVNVLEDRDTIEGLDWHCLPANTAVFNDGLMYIPGQEVLDKDGNVSSDAPPTTPKSAKPEPVQPAKLDKTKARLSVIAASLAERVVRKQTKGTITADFVADVLACTVEEATKYCTEYKNMTEIEARAALVVLAQGIEGVPNE
jgi:HK97 family phage portal protein